MTKANAASSTGLQLGLDRREILRRAAALCTLAVPGYGAAGSDYPSMPIKLVVPVSPGFATDYLARLLADKLRVSMNATIIVENRAGGAAGNVGSEYVARAKPDGYTLLFSSPGPLTINKFLYPKLGFDPAEFVPISVVASAQNVLLVRAASPFKTLREIISHAKANPGALSYASGGAGTTQHLAVEMLKSQAGLDIMHVPYKGSAAAMSGFIQGQSDLFVAELGNSMPFIRDGRLRAIAVGSISRMPSLPDVPTMAETLPSFTTSAWYGLVAPPTTPGSIATTLSAAIADVMKQPDVVAKLQGMMITPIASTPAEMAKFTREESSRWGKLIRSAKIAVD
jgi:tripartite-type tricarboxylate transporter receptor subunit TctC